MFIDQDEVQKPAQTRSHPRAWYWYLTDRHDGTTDSCDHRLGYALRVKRMIVLGLLADFYKG